MMKALLLDAGGVMIAPVKGDWLLPIDYQEVLGEDFIARHLDNYRVSRRDYLHLLPDTHILQTDDEEYAQFLIYYKQSLQAIGITLDDDAIARLSHMLVYRDDRYLMFDDVLPYLDAWRKRYKVGIVSDAPPSTRRIVDNMGILPRVDAATFSCEIGAIKPDPRMYQRTLNLLGIAPEDAVFVDDMPHNLRGAQALGIYAIQMRRPMPEHFDMPQAWDGPIAYDFASLDALLQAL